MDNVTHSLIGALIGQMGLKRKTGLAMPMLIIAANIPDIDAVATLFSAHEHLAIRRGITHGPIAMVVLPLLLWGTMLWFDRWRMQRDQWPFAWMQKHAGHSMPVHKVWLLVLAYIGCLSHPLFDWFNSYGIRLLEPFSSQWFYGDSIFIIDIWLLLALMSGVWVSLRRERRGSASWRVPALVSFASIGFYLLANGFITSRAEQLTTDVLKQQQGINATLVVANPVPIQFWKREMLWRDGTRYGKGVYTAWNQVLLDEKVGAHRMENQHSLLGLQDDRAAADFLFWSRMPVISGTPNRIQINDQRFLNRLMKESFTVVVTAKQEEKTGSE